jgi:acyl-coenzyme A synthetase/AMP-(fatty) acid ligase
VQQRPRYLIDRLDALEAAHGVAIAQSYVASGNPDDEPHEVTFAQFAGAVRRRANALVAIDVSPTDVIGFAAPLSETSYPTMVAAMVAATYAPVNYFLETEAIVRILKASGAGVLLVHPALRRRGGASRQAQARACSTSAAAVGQFWQRPHARRCGGFGDGRRRRAALKLADADARTGGNAYRRTLAYRWHNRASQTRAAYRSDV